jgi:hypothetical protein
VVNFEEDVNKHGVLENEKPSNDKGNCDEFSGMLETTERRWLQCAIGLYLKGKLRKLLRENKRVRRKSEGNKLKTAEKNYGMLYKELKEANENNKRINVCLEESQISYRKVRPRKPEDTNTPRIDQPQ